MDKERIRKQMFDIKWKILLSQSKDANLQRELEMLKKEYAMALYEEKEKEENGKHKK